MSKGSKQRPRPPHITRDDFDAKWDAVFRRQKWVEVLRKCACGSIGDVFQSMGPARTLEVKCRTCWQLEGLLVESE